MAARNWALTADEVLNEIWRDSDSNYDFDDYSIDDMSVSSDKEAYYESAGEDSFDGNDTETDHQNTRNDDQPF